MDFDKIKTTWRKSIKDTPMSVSEIEARLAIRSKTENTLDKIKRNYKVSLFVLVFTYLIFLIGGIYFMFNPTGFILITIVTTLTSVGFIHGYKSYTKINNNIVTGDTIRPALVKTISIMEKSLRFGMGNLYKYVLIPLALIAGIAIGIYIGTGDRGYMETIYALQTKSIIKIILVVVIGSGITIPYSQYLMKRMYKQHFDELKTSLKELEENEN